MILLLLWGQWLLLIRLIPQILLFLFFQWNQ
jgi:hypothetical protein